MLHRVSESTGDYDDLPSNLQKIGTDIWRGAQPYKRGFQRLMQSGVKTVVNLREEQYSIDDEKKLVEELGMHYVSIPLRPFDVPEDHKIEQFLELMANAERHTVFVHCLHGMDRTGMMCAIYRMKAHDWTFEDTYEEMIKMGFHEPFTNLRQMVLKTASSLNKLPDGYL